MAAYFQEDRYGNRTDYMHQLPAQKMPEMFERDPFNPGALAPREPSESFQKGNAAMGVIGMEADAAAWGDETSTNAAIRATVNQIEAQIPSNQPGVITIVDFNTDKEQVYVGSEPPELMGPQDEHIDRRDYQLQGKDWQAGLRNAGPPGSVNYTGPDSNKRNIPTNFVPASSPPTRVDREPTGIEGYGPPARLPADGRNDDDYPGAFSHDA